MGTKKTKEEFRRYFLKYFVGAVIRNTLPEYRGKSFTTLDLEILEREPQRLTPEMEHIQETTEIQTPINSTEIESPTEKAENIHFQQNKIPAPVTLIQPPGMPQEKEHIKTEQTLVPQPVQLQNETFTPKTLPFGGTLVASKPSSTHSGPPQPVRKTLVRRTQRGRPMPPYPPRNTPQQGFSNVTAFNVNQPEISRAREVQPIIQQPRGPASPLNDLTPHAAPTLAITPLAQPQQRPTIAPSVPQTQAPLIKQLANPPMQKSTGAVPTPEQPFGKIGAIIRDPNVTEIEVPGPNKYIQVRRGGVKKANVIALTQGEITAIMNAISTRTKIPLISGMFKAAFSNLVITAVVSNVAGSRFHLQKVRNPPLLPSHR